MGITVASPTCTYYQWATSTSLIYPLRSIIVLTQYSGKGRYEKMKLNSATPMQIHKHPMLVNQSFILFTESISKEYLYARF